MVGFVRDLGVDLGTVNTLVYMEGCGIACNEPSVIAVHRDTGRVLAVGTEARRMLGRAPGHILVVRPLRAGVIADFHLAATMLQVLIARAAPRRLGLRPRLVISVPAAVTAVERRAVVEAAYQAGARKVYLVEQPVAAALGAGLDIQEPGGHLVVDVGGGTTCIAVLSLGGKVLTSSVPVGGDAFDEAIVRHVKRNYNVLISESAAEEVKIALGRGEPAGEDARTLAVRGRDLVSGLPRTVGLTTDEVERALEEPVSVVVGAVRDVLQRVPPELAADLVMRGLLLTGGGSLLRGLDRRLEAGTGLKVVRPESPFETVAMGTGVVLDRLDRLDGLLIAG